jgi:hypothetical protein
MALRVWVVIALAFSIFVAALSRLLHEILSFASLQKSAAEYGHYIRRVADLFSLHSIASGEADFKPFQRAENFL